MMPRLTLHIPVEIRYVSASSNWINPKICSKKIVKIRQKKSDKISFYHLIYGIGAEDPAFADGCKSSFCNVYKPY